METGERERERERERGYVIEITGIVTSDIFLDRHVTGNDAAVNLFVARGFC